jgi:hypothetical protein
VTPLRAVVLTLALLVAVPAAAGDFVTIDDTQLDLVNRGLEAHNAGDYDRAAELFNAALLVQELNVVYLNLGRTLQRGGACGAADEAFGRALTAPAVANPTPDEVKTAVENYRAELVTGCPGEVVLSCPELANASVTIDGKPASCGEPISLLPGDHTAAISSDEGSAETRFQIEGLRTVTVTLAVAPEGGDDPIDEPGAPSRTLTWVGWGLVGVGAVSLATGAWFTFEGSAVEADIAAEARRDTVNASRANALLDDADSIETSQAVAYGFGAATILTGAVLIYLDGDAPEHVSVSPLPGGAAVGITTRW